MRLQLRWTARKKPRRMARTWTTAPCSTCASNWVCRCVPLPGWQTYCCISPKTGKRGCARITSRQIGPSLTELERAAQDAQNRKDAEERARVVEERRRERVLVARYPDKAAHDVERAAAIQMVDDVTATAEKRMLELKAERKKLDVEMEFYKKDPNKAPMTLRRKIAEIDDSLAEQQRFIAGQDQEKRRVHARFDTELSQLRKLWDAQRVPPSAASAVAAPAASAVPAGGSR